MRVVVLVLSSWGFLGYAPFAPGTFGTLGAVPVVWALSGLPTWAPAAAAAALFPIACWAAGRANALYGEVDSGRIVIDEVVGYLITMAFVPWSWTAAALGFAWFRLFDVVKPWPARQLERRYKSGFGVVIDDCAAAVYAHLALRLCLSAFGAPPSTP